MAKSKALGKYLSDDPQDLTGCDPPKKFKPVLQVDIKTGRKQEKKL